MLEGREGGLYAVAFDAQRRALPGSRDTIVRLWDVETGSCLRIFTDVEGIVNAIWSSDQRQAFWRDWKGGIRVWDLLK